MSKPEVNPEEINKGTLVAVAVAARPCCVRRRWARFQRVAALELRGTK